MIVGGLQGLRSDVADDLRDIFRPAAAPAPSAATADPVFAVSRPRPRPHRKIPILIATLGVTSATAVAWLLTPASKPALATAPESAAPVRVAVTTAEPGRPIAVSAEPMRLDLAARTSAIVRLGPTIEDEPAVQAATSEVLAEKPATRLASTQCADMEADGRAWCMRPAVLQADGRLRKAYALAVDAGVDRKMLGSYRSNWSRLRRKAPKNPHLVIDGYEQMARDLNAEAMQIMARRT